MSIARNAQHALETLGQDDLWKWPVTNQIRASGKQSDQFGSLAPKFLYYLIKESLNFGDKVLEQFWQQLGTCHTKLEENIKTLKEQDFVSANESYNMLFQGLDFEDLDFQPVLNMAAEYFTHLGVAFMNPGGPKSGTGSESTAIDFVGEQTEKLLEEVRKGGKFGKRKQGVLKELSFRRDGHSCLLTGLPLRPHDPKGLPADLVYVIPNSMHDKPDTLKCIAMFAGDGVKAAIVKHLNDIGNVMNMEKNTHLMYDELMWGIEARDEGDGSKYFFRLVPTEPNGRSPGLISLKDGDEIHFGESEALDKPKPELCNLQLAVARVMKMSAAADIVLKWKEEADDDGCHGHLIPSEEFCDILDAKLFLSGRAVVV